MFISNAKMRLNEFTTEIGRVAEGEYASPSASEIDGFLGIRNSNASLKLSGNVGGEGERSAEKSSWKIGTVDSGAIR